MRKTKIVCTIGPASQDEKTLEHLMLKGMDVARINFSHGNLSEKKKEIKSIRSIAKKLGKNITILQDLSGPKIRIGDLQNGEIDLKQGSTIHLTSQEKHTGNNAIYINYPYLEKDIQKKDDILLDDGKIKLIVKDKKSHFLICEVLSGGKLKSRKGVNFPSRSLRIPAITPKDILDIKFGIAQGVDYIALSFVRKADDILMLKKIINRAKSSIPVIAKIEKHEAMENLDEIIKAADGIMVARGDLGVEVPIENVPVFQKIIIKKSNQAGKPVITATQMLESMIENSSPTRAEATDISNAILDGTDAIMLSAETSIGKYPVEAVSIMDKIAVKTEQIIDYSKYKNADYYDAKISIADAVADGACHMASDLSATAIMTFTASGYTARMISKYRPKAPIYAFTSSERVSKIVNLYRGVKSFVIKEVRTTDDMFKIALRTAASAKIIKKDDLVILTAGIPVEEKENTNLIRVVKVK